MKKNTFIALLTCCILNACNTISDVDSIAIWKKEIVNTENEFAKMAQEEGISKAFLSYAAKDAVLMRNNNLIIGKDAIKEHLNAGGTNSGQVSLTWKPDFVDVSESGDLGYTYGKYNYMAIDSLGKKTTANGVFHTVWKRQEDGKWRFVWD